MKVTIPFIDVGRKPIKRGRRPIYNRILTATERMRLHRLRKTFPDKKRDEIIADYIIIYGKVDFVDIEYT